MTKVEFINQQSQIAAKLANEITALSQTRDLLDGQDTILISYNGIKVNDKSVPANCVMFFQERLREAILGAVDVLIEETIQTVQEVSFEEPQDIPVTEQLCESTQQHLVAENQQA